MARRTPIDQKSVLATITRMADEVIPRMEKLRKLDEAGYAYAALGFLLVDTTWSVDREGRVTVGGGLKAEVDMARLAARALGAITVRPENESLAAELKAASERSHGQAGEGTARALFLPLVVPKSEMPATAAALRELAGLLSTRGEVFVHGEAAVVSGFPEDGT